jgi:hypothetical protein
MIRRARECWKLDGKDDRDGLSDNAETTRLAMNVRSVATLRYGPNERTYVQQKAWFRPPVVAQANEVREVVRCTQGAVKEPLHLVPMHCDFSSGHVDAVASSRLRTRVGAGVKRASAPQLQAFVGEAAHVDETDTDEMVFADVAKRPRCSYASRPLRMLVRCTRATLHSQRSEICYGRKRQNSIDGKLGKI